MLLSTEYGKLLKRDIGFFGLLFRPTIYGPYSFVRPVTVTILRRRLLLLPPQVKRENPCLQLTGLLGFDPLKLIVSQ